MRPLDYEVTLERPDVRLAAYTVEIAGRRFIVTRQLGSAKVRVSRLSPPSARALPNPNTRRRRGFGPV
jgi:hypothetical protein